MTTSPAFQQRASAHERWLLTAAQQDDHRAQEQLVRRYEPLVHAAARPRASRHTRRSDREDLAQVARSALWRAIRTWQPRRGPFRNYARACVHNSVLNEILAAGTHRRHVLANALSINEADAQVPLYHRWLKLDPARQHPDLLPDPAAVVLVRDELAAIRSRVSQLTARERRLLAGALNDQTQQQLADQEDTSPPAINCAITRLRAKLNPNAYR